MATLEENIKQAIDDFDDIKNAIEEQGVEVPAGTDTSEYGDKIRSIPKTGGGGAGVLIVHYDGVTQGSHRPKQIYDHISAGGTAILYHELESRYYTLEQCDVYFAIFAGAVHDDGVDLNYIVIDEDGDYTEEVFAIAMNLQVVGLEEKIGDIDTALDSIIAIQQSLIGGDGE